MEVCNFETFILTFKQLNTAYPNSHAMPRQITFRFPLHDFLQRRTRNMNPGCTGKV